MSKHVGVFKCPNCHDEGLPANEAPCWKCGAIKIAEPPAPAATPAAPSGVYYREAGYRVRPEDVTAQQCDPVNVAWLQTEFDRCRAAVDQYNDFDPPMGVGARVCEAVEWIVDSVVKSGVRFRQRQPPPSAPASEGLIARLDLMREQHGELVCQGRCNSCKTLKDAAEQLAALTRDKLTIAGIVNGYHNGSGVDGLEAFRALRAIADVLGKPMEPSGSTETNG